MKLFEKIRHIRQDVLGLSLTDFHAKLVEYFGNDNALTYASLNRLENGHRDEIRRETLRQICKGFGMTLEELKEGTDEEESRIAFIVRAADKKHNPYNEDDATGNILTPDESRFFVTKFLVKPGGITRVEKDPTNQHEKLISVLQGEIMVYVGKERHLLKSGDSIYFASNIRHRLANPSKNVTARCVIVQNPKPSDHVF